MFKAPEKYRIKTGILGSDESYKNNGYFVIKTLKLKAQLKVICSDKMGWEHVSVSHHKRTPTWDEMCFIKNLFWHEEDIAVQFHPAKKDYINNHPYCLHLFRKFGTNNFCEKPNKLLVGL